VSRNRTLAILANLEKPGVDEIYARIAQWSAENGYKLVSNLDGRATVESSGTPFGYRDPAILAKRFSKADILVTMGGDGTLLYTAQVAAMAQMPVLSVNLGSLGFHTQVSPHNLSDCLAMLRTGEFLVENRMILQAELPPEDGKEPSILALNDIVVSKSVWGHVVNLQISVNGERVTDIAADALIVSSPTGSSAYNYAAGGPILYPSMDALILNALCAHRMRVSPLVVPGDSFIEVTLKPRRSGESAQVLNDGQPWRTVADEEILKISRASMYLPLIVFENDFYGKLRDKLRWGGLF